MRAFNTVRWLPGSGLGFIDTHFLASVLLVPNVKLCTHDKRLLAAPLKLKLAFAENAYARS